MRGGSRKSISKENIMNELVRGELVRIVREYGEEILLNPARTLELLDNSCGSLFNREREYIALALNEGVVVDLLDSRSNNTESFVLEKLRENLSQNFALSESQAVWTIDSFAMALGITKANHIKKHENDFYKREESELFTKSMAESFFAAQESKRKSGYIVTALLATLALVIVTVFIIISEKNAIPGNRPPVLLSRPSPADKSTDQLTELILSWDCRDPEGDTITYDVYLGTSSNPTNKVSSKQTGKTLIQSNLSIGTTYYWKVIAEDIRGAITEGPVWQFKTQIVNRKPDAPSNPVPSHRATKRPLITTLSWDCSDPDGDSLTYDVYFGTSSNPTTKVATNQRNETFESSGLSYGTTYYWKVVAKDVEGETTEGPVWQFTTNTVNTKPDAPSNPAPSDRATNQPLITTLSWDCSDPDGDSLTYDVYFGTSSSPTTRVATNQSDRKFVMPNLLRGATYYWKVVARDSEGATTEGQVWKFTTQSAPTASSYTPSNIVPPMVLVEKGSFTMGDTWGDGESSEKPTHRVTFTYDFEIGKYEVTFNEYDFFCEITGSSKPYDGDWGRGQRPTNNVSWWDAIAYCNWLSEREGLPKAYDSNGNLLDKYGRVTTDPSKVVGYRLPTEAEWEYAARGGDRSREYKYSGSDNVDDVAWYLSNSGYETHEVGQKLPNALGIHDMSGNVWEWCGDWWNASYYSHSSTTNPYNGTVSDNRVVRGGSWYRNAFATRVSYRTNRSPYYSDSNLGFRICRTLF